MKSTVKRVVERLHDSETGFTLIEMLIVVGIIVALAAAIVPQVVQFGGRGATAQQTSENEAIQTAMDAMLAETLAGRVTASASGAAALNTWASQPLGPNTAFLSPTYFRGATTTFYYCWDADGQITTQVEAAAAAGACP